MYTRIFLKKFYRESDASLILVIPGAVPNTGDIIESDDDEYRVDEVRWDADGPKAIVSVYNGGVVKA